MHNLNVLDPSRFWRLDFTLDNSDCKLNKIKNSSLVSSPSQEPIVQFQEFCEPVVKIPIIINKIKLTIKNKTKVIHTENSFPGDLLHFTSTYTLKDVCLHCVSMEKIYITGCYRVACSVECHVETGHGGSTYSMEINEHFNSGLNLLFSGLSRQRK